MTAPPLISVIIPTWNASRFIEATLASVAAQSYETLEILVCDDGSTDDTGTVVEKIAVEDRRVRFIKQAHSGLPGRVRNAGIEAAKGEFIATLDADDLWIASKLDSQLNALQADPEASFAYCAVATFKDGESIPRLDEALALERASPAMASERLIGREGARRLIQRRTFIATSSLLIRRSAIGRAGGYDSDPRLECSEDVEFILRLHHAGGAVFVPQTLVLKREHAGNQSHRASGESVFAMMERLEASGRFDGALMRAGWSAAWIVRGEEKLRGGVRGWRGEFFNAWRRSPGDVRRWGALAACAMPRAAAHRYYFTLRKRAS